MGKAWCQFRSRELRGKSWGLYIKGPVRKKEVRKNKITVSVKGGGKEKKKGGEGVPFEAVGAEKRTYQHFELILERDVAGKNLGKVYYQDRRVSETGIAAG